MRHPLLHLFMFLMIIAGISGVCNKDPEGPDPVIDPPIEVLDTTASFLVYNVNQGKPTTTYYEYKVAGAANVLNIHVDNNGDTVNALFMFSGKRVNGFVGIPLWKLCEVPYNAAGKDEYIASFQWLSTSGSTLTAGRTYNLNFPNIPNAPIIGSRGTVRFNHYNASGTLLKSIYTFHAGVDDSWIKVEKIENNKASGTFFLEFLCIFPGTANGQVTTVEGRFNKIPIM